MRLIMSCMHDLIAGTVTYLKLFSNIFKCFIDSNTCTVNVSTGFKISAHVENCPPDLYRYVHRNKTL